MIYLVPKDPKYDLIGFDVIEAENHAGASVPTDNPIESGALVTDHVIHEPASFDFRGSTTLSPWQTTFYGDGTEGPVTISTITQDPVTRQAQQTPIRISAFRDSREGDRIREMLERLETLRAKSVLLSVITSVRDYEDMIVIRVELPRGPLSKGIGRFSVYLRQIQIVSTEETIAPAPKEPRGEKLKAKGAKSASDPVKDLVDKFKNGGKSWALTGFDYVTGK